MKLNKLFALLTFTATSWVVGLSSCTSSLPELTIKLDSLASSDTLAWVTYLGDGIQQTDTLLHFEPTLHFSPDTARFHSVIFTHAASTRVHYYMLQGKERKEVTTIPVDTTMVTTAIPFEAVDIQGKHHTCSELYMHQRVTLVFASPENLASLTRREQERLQAQARPDSLHWVILYPTASDSTARQRFRRDSLRGIAISDSLGVVSQLRKGYGIQGLTRPTRFQIDTLGRVKRS